MGNEPGKISSGGRIMEGLEGLAEEFKHILENMGAIDGSRGREWQDPH